MGCVVVVPLILHILRVPARCAGYAADLRQRLMGLSPLGAPALRAVMHRTVYRDRTPTRSRWADLPMRGEERDKSGPPHPPPPTIKR